MENKSYEQMRIDFEELYFKRIRHYLLEYMTRNNPLDSQGRTPIRFDFEKI